jgi:hypothetical protein
MRPLQQYSGGLRKLSAADPLKQAVPITREQVKHILSNATLGLGDKVAIFLCWKTASRWDEMTHLTKTSFLKVNDSEIIIRWGARTKTSQTNPWQLTNWTVIVPGPDLGMNLWMLWSAQKINKLGPQKLTNLQTSQLARVLKAEHPALSAHSIKRGAVTLLLEHAAAGRVPTAIVSRLAKHAMPGDISSSTLRYGQNSVTIARLLQTQLATQFL